MKSWGTLRVMAMPTRLTQHLRHRRWSPPRSHPVHHQQIIPARRWNHSV